MRALIGEAVDLIVSIVRTDRAPAAVSTKSWPSTGSRRQLSAVQSE